MAHELGRKWRSSDILLEEKISFSSLIQKKHVLMGLKAAGFQRPSPVQAKAIPIARLGVDMFIQAKSGTGKTLVFSIVMLERLGENPNLQMLVITPTREIAVQVQNVIYDISTGFPGLRCQTFIGGSPVDQDIINLQDCQIAVGTPGRIRHLMESGHMNTSCVKTLVLDEADKLCGCNDQMFDEIKFIFSRLPISRQIIAVSATYENEAFENIHTYMKTPRYVNMSESELALQGVSQFYQVVEVEEADEFSSQQKFDVLKNILCSISFSQCLIFCRSIKMVQSFCGELIKWNFPASAITGTDEQTLRLCTMERLKSHRIKILVTSDLNARGIDAENVDLVIHLDPSKNLETYLHRVGRAGRYGTKGVSIAIACNNMEILKLASYKNRAQLSIYPLPDPLPRCLNQYQPTEKDEDAIIQCIKNIDEKFSNENNISDILVIPKTVENSTNLTEKEEIALDDLIDDSEEEAEEQTTGNNLIKSDTHQNNFTSENQANIKDRSEGSDDAISDQDSIGSLNNKFDMEDIMDFPEDNDKNSTDSETDDKETCALSNEPPNKNDVSEMEKLKDLTLVKPLLNGTIMNSSKNLKNIESTNSSKISVLNSNNQSLPIKTQEENLSKNQESNEKLIPKVQSKNEILNLLPCDKKTDHGDCDKVNNENVKVSKDQNRNSMKKVTLFSAPAEGGGFFMNSSEKSKNLKSPKKDVMYTPSESELNNREKFKTNEKEFTPKTFKNKSHLSDKKCFEKMGEKFPKSIPKLRPDCPLTITSFSSKHHSRTHSNEKSQDYFDERKNTQMRQSPFSQQYSTKSYSKIEKSHRPHYNHNKPMKNNNESFRAGSAIYKKSYSSKYDSEFSKHFNERNPYSSGIKKNSEHYEANEPNYLSRKSCQANRSRCMKQSYDNFYPMPVKDFSKNNESEKGRNVRKLKPTNLNQSFCHCESPQTYPKYRNMSFNNQRSYHKKNKTSDLHSHYNERNKSIHCPFCNEEMCCNRMSELAVSNLSSFSSNFQRNEPILSHNEEAMKRFLYPFKHYPPRFLNHYDGDVDYGKFLHEICLSSKSYFRI